MRTTARQTAKRLASRCYSSVLGFRAHLTFALLVGASCLVVERESIAMGPNNSGAPAIRIDWTTMPSTFTHDHQGTRVDQYAQGVQPVVYERPDYQRSGFRHYRSSLQGGSSADHMHVVDQWGPSVRPYGEWRYPARPFSVPYPAWGPQLPLTSVNSNFNNQVQFPGGGFPVRPWPPVQPAPGWGQAGNQPGGNPGGVMPPNWPQWQGGNGMGPGGFHPGFNNEHSPYGVGQYGVGPANALRADQDEYYRDAPEPPQLPDREFFFSPAR